MTCPQCGSKERRSTQRKCWATPHPWHLESMNSDNFVPEQKPVGEQLETMRQALLNKYIKNNA